MNNHNSITFIFPNKEIMDSFAGWMCDGGGEYEFIESSDLELHFDYHQGKGFLENGVVEVTVTEDEDE